MILGMIALALIVVSFFTGSYVKEQEYSSIRKQRCGTLVSFALDKVENEGISDRDTMEALISNIYAAYELCDDPVLQKQLHDLWNCLIFDSGDHADTKDMLLVELQSVSDGIKTRN